MYRVCCKILLTIFLAVCSTKSDTSRLNRDVLPRIYDIKLQPDFDDWSFSGEVKIILDVKRTTDKIVLHSDSLDIEKIELDYTQASHELMDIDFLSIEYKDKKEIPPGEHIIYISYSGNFSESTGLAAYQENDILIMASNLESVYARKVFPCFDEPFFKARFHIKLLKPNDTYTALSNMEQIGSYDLESGILEEFQISVPISTYSLAFVLTTSNYTETQFQQNNKSIPLRLFSQGSEEDVEFAISVAQKAMEYLIGYTNIEYPLPKLDLIEIPNYKIEAIEQWGLITFGSNLLVRKNMKYGNIPDWAFHFSAPLLISHEISHMYFGNLVTPGWFSDLWLKEGFARYMEYKISDYMMDQLPMLDYMPFIQDMIIYVAESSSDSLPLINRVETLERMDVIYEWSLYPKGGMVVKMIHDVLGEKRFQLAMQEYLEKYKYQSVTTGDLIEFLQSFESDIDWFSFLEEWLYRNRYPSLTVTEDKESDTFKVTQECSPVNMNSETNSTNDCYYKWTIPITFTTSTDGEPQMEWFDKEATHISIPKQNASWIKLNHKHGTLFQTNYDEHLWKELTENLHELHSLDQVSLLTDAFILYKFDKVPCSVQFSLLGKLQNSPEPATWGILSQFIYRDFKVYNLTTSDKILQKFYESIGQELYQTLGWDVKETDATQTRATRIMFLLVMCMEIKSSKCLDDIKRIKTNNVTLHDEVKWIAEQIPDSFDSWVPTPLNTKIPEKVLKCSEWVNKELLRTIAEDNGNEI